MKVITLAKLSDVYGKVDLLTTVLDKKSWRKFIRTKDIVDWDKCKFIRNTVRYNTRQLCKDEQNNISKDCKSNQKKFRNYITNKTKESH